MIAWLEPDSWPLSAMAAQLARGSGQGGRGLSALAGCIDRATRSGSRFRDKIGGWSEWADAPNQRDT